MTGRTERNDVRTFLVKVFMNVMNFAYFSILRSSISSKVLR